MITTIQPWLESWESVEQIGDGGQGEVYKLRARDDVSKLAVVKTLASRWKGNVDAINRLDLEIITLRRLSECGAKVPKVYGAHLDHEKNESTLIEPYLLMEFIQGDRFHEWLIANAPTSVETARIIVLGLLSTLRHCHAQNVGHRDIKPKNIILKGGDILEPYLIDFGISFDSQQTVALTQKGEVFWNEFIMLPECTDQVGGHRDLRSDITALAGVYFRCITGCSPNVLLDGNGQSPQMRHQEKLRKASNSPFQYSELVWLFNKAFAYKPADRYKSLEEFEAALEQVSTSKDEPNTDLLAEATLLASDIRTTDPAALRLARKARRERAIDVVAAKISKEIQFLNSTSVVVSITKADVSKNAEYVAAMQQHDLRIEIGSNLLKIKLSFPPASNFVELELLACEGKTSLDFLATSISGLKPIPISPRTSKWKKVAELEEGMSFSEDQLKVLSGHVKAMLHAEIRNIRALRVG